MLLFYGIKFSKLKCFIGIVLLKKSITFLRFVQVYEFAVLGFCVLKKLLS